jgi:hypothetical protein
MGFKLLGFIKISRLIGWLFQYTIASKITLVAVACALDLIQSGFFHRYWNLVFNTSASALYGKCKVMMRDDSSVTTTYVGADNQSTCSCRPIFGGIMWERNFAEDANHISLLLAYENTYWCVRINWFDLKTA